MAAKKEAPVKVATEEGLGVADLAKLMDVEPATARVKLRNAKIKKTAGKYTWRNQTELKKIASQLSA